MVGNVIVGQSGGPTAVINSSLVGVYQTAILRGAKKVYGMRNGIQGLLNRRYVDLSEHIKTNLDIELLKRTPSSYLGSCRYKLPEVEANHPIYEQIFAILKELDIKAFFYIGGNDSMDTIQKLYDYGQIIGTDICFVGVPKTIDNDLAITDHTPGYGSAAKYIASITKEIIRDALVYDSESVTILEIMGRNAGWLTGAAALAREEDCEGADFLLLPEIPLSLEKLYDKVVNLMKKKKSIIIAVSEGVKNEKGEYISSLTNNATVTDAFGHNTLSGVGQYLANYLGERLGCKVRSLEFSTMQRCGGHLVSRVDITEAFQVGGAAVKAAFSGATGSVVVLKRASQEPYICTTDVYDVHEIANLEKKVPREWINESGDYVTEEFLAYARPLIQAELSPIMVEGLPGHLILPKE